MKKAVWLFILAGVVSLAQAQNFSPDDSVRSQKRVNKYLGIQANLLLQQFISFNSNSSINTNPYVFTYTSNNTKSGRGFVFGTGFNISQNSSNDGVAAVTVDNRNITFRFGGERKYLQEQKFIPFWGVEFGFGGTFNRVESTLNQSFNNNSTVVETTRFFMGPAFRGGLNYSLAKNIQVGTEFFFNFQLAYSETSVTGGFGSNSFEPFNIGFQAPTALYLIFKY